MENCSNALCHLNFIGGMIGVVIAYSLGALWYSKLFLGNAWMKLQNKTEEQIRSQSALLPMIVSAFYHLVLGGLVIGIHFLSKGCPFVFWISIFVLMITSVLGMLQGVLFEDRNIKLWVITAGHEVVVIAVIALCVFFI